MATPVQIVVNSAAGGGVVVALPRACGYIKVTMCDGTTGHDGYVAFRNVNNGDSIANISASPVPPTGSATLSTGGGVTYLPVSGSIEYDMSKSIAGPSPDLVSSKITHVLFFTTLSSLIQIIGN